MFGDMKDDTTFESALKNVIDKKKRASSKGKKSSIGKKPNIYNYDGGFEVFDNNDNNKSSSNFFKF